MIVAKLMFFVFVLLITTVAMIESLRDIRCYCYNDPAVCPRGQTIEHCSGSCIIVLNGVHAPYAVVQLGCTTVIRNDTDVDKVGDNTYHYCNNDYCNDPNRFHARQNVHALKQAHSSPRRKD
ncbi:hypothetical protein M3Y95_01084400 [Aphelenchoides besseyi]|nr:hypothetical protein M3Y95_01084400 [Aphelenchoides besseyi]